MNTKPNVAVCQFKPEIGDREENIEKIRDITSSLKPSVKVAVFPELCVSGYHLPTVPKCSCDIPCEHTNELSQIAQNQDVLLVVGIPTVQDSELCNSLVAINSDGVESVYNKNNLAGGEDEIFQSGEGHVTVETPAGLMGMMVCYDMSFPEEMIPYGNKKCDFVAVSSAWRNGWHDDWRLIAKTRALENSTYVIASNQMGNQGSRFNDGESIIVSPYGNIQSNLKQEEYADSVSIDKEVLENARTYNPVVDDRQS